MFRSSTIIREPALNLAKVIFILKHSVKLVVIYYAVVWQQATAPLTSKIAFYIFVQQI